MIVCVLIELSAGRADQLRQVERSSAMPSCAVPNLLDGLLANCRLIAGGLLREDS